MPADAPVDAPPPIPYGTFSLSWAITYAGSPASCASVGGVTLELTSIPRADAGVAGGQNLDLGTLVFTF